MSEKEKGNDHANDPFRQTNTFRDAVKDEKSKRIAQLMAKAWADPKFKQKLLNAPNEAFDEFGIEVPEGVAVKVLENTDDVIHFILPPPPINLSKVEFGKLPIHVMDCPCSHCHEKETFCRECWHCSD